MISGIYCICGQFFTVSPLLFNGFSDERYLDELKPLNDSKDEHRPNEAITFDIVQSHMRGNAISKWIGPNGRLSTSHFVPVSEANRLMKNGTRRMVEEKQKTETERRSIDHSKLSNEQNSNSESDLTSKNKIKSPQFEANVRKTSDKLTRKPIPFHTNTHYFKLPKEIKKSSHKHFKREASNQRERAIPSGPISEEKPQLNNLTGTQAATGSTHGTHKIPYISNLPVPSNCPPLDPLLNSSLHTDTDESCGQSLQGWTKDPNCVCIYFVAEYNDEGCPAKFHTLCYRPIYQKVGGTAEGKDLDLRASETSLGRNNATHSSGGGQISSDNNQELLNQSRLQSNQMQATREVEESHVTVDRKLKQSQ
ncbi:unnamed protein product [Litomosoides sigmodontis]|uniref:Uncharacterized protein n=1 Tax=Litomosoides sigmodontis TaxID=42156 RepID=A0A3P6V4Y8_LITSI|nr:unnamed protein product [Litomosoides sigmodontis]